MEKYLKQEIIDALQEKIDYFNHISFELKVKPAPQMLAYYQACVTGLITAIETVENLD